MLKIAEFLKILSSIDRVKLLAYHDLSRTKYEALGIKYGMVDVKPPREDEYNQVFEIFKKAGLNVIHK